MPLTAKSRRLLTCNLEDALLVGGLLNSLLRNSNRVKIACLAQLVNVIAPIVTNANGLLRQTIFYPYSWALQFAQGAALNLVVESPAYEVSRTDQVPYMDVAGTASKEAGNVCLFVFNRDLSRAHQLEIHWEGFLPARVVQSMVLTGDDLKAFNSFEVPKRVTPRALEKPTTTGSRTHLEVPARSYSVVQWSL